MTGSRSSPVCDLYRIVVNLIQLLGALQVGSAVSSLGEKQKDRLERKRPDFSGASPFLFFIPHVQTKMLLLVFHVSLAHGMDEMD